MAAGILERCPSKVCHISGNRMLLVLRVDIARVIMGYEECPGPVLLMSLQIWMRSSSGSFPLTTWWHHKMARWRVIGGEGGEDGKGGSECPGGLSGLLLYGNRGREG